jgi:hypothetical protein
MTNLLDVIRSEEDPYQKKTVIRSDIAFPYIGLDDATLIAQAIFNNGASLSRDQIAGVMGLTGNGSFSLRIAAARMFGLIDSAPDGKYILTDLGNSIMSTDEYEAKFARKEAFLRVPLYQKTYETFRNRNLPHRPHGLEQAFVTFGVSPKQKDKARQAFERSAQAAGFFDVSRDRLVEPIIAPAMPAGTKSITLSGNIIEQEEPAAAAAPIALDATQEPLIHGLLKRMPPIGTDWPLKDRVKWLRTLAGNLDAVYTNKDFPDDQIELKIINLIEDTVR